MTNKIENEICENCRHTRNKHTSESSVCFEFPTFLKRDFTHRKTGDERMCHCKRFKPKTQNHSQDAEGILSSAGSAKTLDFQKHRLLTLDAREPAKISGIQGPQNNKPTAETDKAADTQTLSDKITTLLKIEKIPQGILRVKDVKSAVQKILESFNRDWENANGKTFTLNEIKDIIKSSVGEDLI